MTKPINEEGKEFELEETTYSRRLLAEPRHIQLQSLLDANDELVIGTVWQFLKELITTNNGSFNPETLDTISNEVEKINLKIVQSKHTSNYKATNNFELFQKHNAYKPPFNFELFQKQITNETTSEIIKTKQSKQINKEISNKNNDNMPEMDDINSNQINNDNDETKDTYDSFVTDTYYSKVSCPLTLILRFMSNTTVDIHICDNLTKLPNSEQCKYLNGGQISSAKLASNAIQQQLSLTSKNMDPLTVQLEQYYEIILYPQKIIECTLPVFVATIILITINLQRCIDNINIWESLYFLFAFIQQYDSLESKLLSFTRSELPSILSQKVVDKYNEFGKKINVKILEYILKKWVQKDMTFYAIKFTKRSTKQCEVHIHKNVTNKLIMREYICKYFNNVKELFHNILYSIKMQLIDCSYKTFKNNIGCLALQLTIFSSVIICDDEPMYIVVIQIDKKSEMTDLLSIKQLKQLYGINECYLPINIKDLIQLREDKLLYGYIRSLVSSCLYEIFGLCKQFFSYAKYGNNLYYKQSIFISNKEPITIKKQNKSKTDMITILQDVIYERIPNVINSKENKYKCFSVILFDKYNGMDTYYRDDVLPLDINNHNWIGWFPRTNTFCNDWNKLQKHAMLYDISFDINECKEWKNDIKSLIIQPRQEGKILWYNYSTHSGRIVCNGIQFKFCLKYFSISNDCHIYNGMPVYFYEGKKKRAVNGRPINKEGNVSYYDHTNKYGWIQCDDINFKFDREDFLINNDSYIYEGMNVYFCEARWNGRAIEVKPINKKYNKL